MIIAVYSKEICTWLYCLLIFVWLLNVFEELKPVSVI